MARSAPFVDVNEDDASTYEARDATIGAGGSLWP